MPDTTPIAWRKTFADLDVTLTDLELAAINAGCENMSERDEHLRGHPKDWDHSAFKLLEGGSQHGDDGAAVALDPDAFQIIRYHDHTKDTPWLRFGLQLRSGLEGTERNGNDFTAFVRHGMFQHSDDGSNVDLTDKALDDVAWRLTKLRDGGQRVVALLGKARLDIKQGMALLEPVQKLVACFTDVAYMTGGYRGEAGNSYGVTRAGFDVPKAKRLETLVIICFDGVRDAHQTAGAMSTYGRHWGDDTPGLATVSDAAVFFRNIPAGQVYGKWTDVEIANFLHQNKPLVIFDPQASVTAETHFGAQVPVFKTAEEAAEYLNTHLPTPATIKERPPLHVEPPTKGHLQHEEYIAVRLYLNPNDPKQWYARWVRQDAKGHEPFRNAGLEFRESQDAFDGERDLVLDGYWKDIMLLQILDKLPQTGDQLPATDDLASAYAAHRKTLEQMGQKGQKWSWWNYVQTQKAIDGIWFMWPVEHQSGAFDMLPNWPKDAYSQKAAGG